MLAITQIDFTAVVHPDCYLDSTPFFLDSIFLASATAITLVTAVLFALVYFNAINGRGGNEADQVAKPGKGGVKQGGAWSPEKKLARVTKAFTSMVLVMFARTCGLSFKFLHCIRDDDGALLLASNPSFRCWQGPHVVPAALAVAAIAIMQVLQHLFCSCKFRNLADTSPTTTNTGLWAFRFSPCCLSIAMRKSWRLRIRARPLVSSALVLASEMLLSTFKRTLFKKLF